MSLFVIATPIGHPKDITLRAVETLGECELIIGEERSEVSKLLKSLGLTGKPTVLLNEHSKPDEIQELLEECRHQKVALVSDCGTPGFCDPGAELVKMCRKEKIEVTPIPGVSSLMTLISVSGLRLRDFLFVGFLPAENVERAKAVQKLKLENRPCVLMDTPYRLSKLLSELSQNMPSRNAVIGLNLTQAEEKIIVGSLSQLNSSLTGQKAEFMLILEGTNATPPRKF